MIRLKAKILTFCGVLLLLQSCGWQSAAPTIQKENAEDVKLVLYLGGDEATWKSAGETILIDTGELLDVQHDKVRPDPKYMTKDWGGVFDPAFRSGQVPLKLDRKNGVVCNANQCATWYYICPSWAGQSATKKECVSFGQS